MFCAVFCLTAWALIMGLLFGCVQSPRSGFFSPRPALQTAAAFAFPRHRRAGRRAPGTHGGSTRPFLLPDSRHRARGDVSRVTPAWGEACFPCPACTTVTAALRRARPGRERAGPGREKEPPGRAERRPSRRRALVPTSMPATCHPGIARRQGVRWDLPASKGDGGFSSHRSSGRDG